jgi:hypothetical protein
MRELPRDGHRGFTLTRALWPALFCWHCDSAPPGDTGGTMGSGAVAGAAGLGGPGGESNGGAGALAGSGGTAGTMGANSAGEPGVVDAGDAGNLDASVDGSGGTAGSTGGAGGAPSLVCGDGIRGVVDEECDDGNADESGDSCSNDCRVRDVLAVNGTTADGAARPVGRSLREGRHPVASGSARFAVAFVEANASDARVGLVSFDAVGVPDPAPTYFGDDTSALFGSSPVLAALSDGSFAAAWTDLDSGFGFDGDGDELGIALRSVDAETGTLGTLRHANENASTLANRSDFSQRDPDLIRVFDEVVLAWVDDADPVNGPDLRFRVFDESLEPLTDVEDLATSAAGEANVALAPTENGWAAAWRSADGGSEHVEVRGFAAGASDPQHAWNVGPYRPPAAEDRPGIAEIAPGLLLLVFTEATDPEATGVAEIARVRGALLDAAAPGSVTAFSIDPLDPAYADPGIAQSQPNVISVQGRTYVTWRSRRAPADSRGEELWIKEVRCFAAPASCGNPAPDLARFELRLPAQSAHREGDQRFPAIAASVLGPSGAVIAAWDDYGSTFGAIQGVPDVVVELIPTPILRLGGG